MDIHLIPGLGADHRLFNRFLVDAPHRFAHDWPDMPEGSSLVDFAKKLALEVDSSRPHILIGMSMGGMVVQEMAALTKPKAVAIISSWKGPAEMPLHIRALRGKGCRCCGCGRRRVDRYAAPPFCSAGAMGFASA